MPSINVVRDKGTGLEYDAELATCQTMRSDNFTATMKADGTVDGNPILLISSDGVGMAFTVRNFLQLAAAVSGLYPEANDRTWPKMPAGNQIKGVHRAVPWEAVLMEKFYLIGLKGAPGAISIAGSEAEVRPLAESMVDRALGIPI